MSIRRDRRSFSNINITPFVDVMLVLLIIFMVTAPLMQTGVEVQLPEAESREMKITDEQFILSLTKDGKVFINKNEFTLEKLEEKLPLLVKERNIKDVYLRADKDVTYGFVIKIMALVKAAGVDRMGMITQPLEKGK